MLFKVVDEIKTPQIIILGTLRAAYDRVHTIADSQRVFLTAGIKNLEVLIVCMKFLIILPFVIVVLFTTILPPFMLFCFLVIKVVVFNRTVIL